MWLLLTLLAVQRPLTLDLRFYTVGLNFLLLSYEAKLSFQNSSNLLQQSLSAVPPLRGGEHTLTFTTVTH